MQYKESRVHYGKQPNCERMRVKSHTQIKDLAGGRAAAGVHKAADAERDAAEVSCRSCCGRPA